MNTWNVADFCTLPVASQPLRLMEFDELFRSQIKPPRRIEAHRVEFTFANANGLFAHVSDLVARETACCSFFEFTINQHAQDATDQDQLVLRVGVTASRDDVLEALTDRALAAIRSGGDEH
jgi:hypothetical protein